MPNVIRYLSPVDVARIAVLRGPDWAAKPVGIPSGRHPSFSAPAFLLERVRLRCNGTCFVSLNKGGLAGLASIRKGSGPTAWFVNHLVAARCQEDLMCDLLGKGAAYAGRRGGERLFLNAPEEWDIQETMCISGFHPSVQVSALTLPGRIPLLGVEPAQGFRPRSAADDHPLFRLYNAFTPASVRADTGMTLQQWKDAQEPRSRRTRELVLEEGGDVKAWLRMDHHRLWTKVVLTASAALQGCLPSIVAFVLNECQSRTLWWEVPEYEEGIRLLLERLGFEASGRYRLMVKSLVRMVTEPARAAVSTSV